MLHQVLPIDHQSGEHRRLLQSGKPIASRRGRFRGSNGCGFNPRHPPLSYQKSDNPLARARQRTGFLPLPLSRSNESR